MKIYIEHTDGNFYDLSSFAIGEIGAMGDSPVGMLVEPERYKTDKRDFEIGSRVYFQSVGWTGVVGREGGCIASGCAFERSCEHCLDDVLCLADEREEAVKFVSIETKRESARTTSDYNNVDHPKQYFEMKNDNGKPRMDLLPFDALKGVSDVLTFGANKYTPNGWKDVPDAIPRYEAALLRHFTAIKTGEQNDPETGLPHIHHVACNALFLASLTGQESK